MHRITSGRRKKTRKKKKKKKVEVEEEKGIGTKRKKKKNKKAEINSMIHLIVAHEAVINGKVSRTNVD